MLKAKIVRLGNIINFKRGYDLPSYLREEGQHPILSSGGITGYHSEYKVEGEGVITGRYGTLGEVQYVKGKYWPHNTTLYVTDFKGNSPKYVYYLLKALGNLKTSDKSTVPGINRNDLHEVEIPYLPLENQQKIAKVLSDLDAKIELNKLINTDLEAMAKMIYEYWFVQFDFPFDFKQNKPADKTSSSEDIKPYKSSGGKMVWNKELKREIPEGWEGEKLNSVTTFVSRGISPIYLEEGGICVLNQKCIRDQKINYEFSRRHDHHTKNPASKSIEKLDILVNSTGVGTLGRVGIVKWKIEKMVTVDSHVTIVRSDQNKINPYFSGFSLLQKQNEIEGFSLGSTGQIELSRSQLEEIKLIVPPPFFQDLFGLKYSDILEKTSINEKQNQELSSLRDWLLPMLMNGQVKVAEVEERLEKELGMVGEEREKYKASFRRE